MDALDFLIYPHNTKTFLSETYEEKPLYIQRSDPNYFSEYLTIEDVDSIVSTRRLRDSDLRVVSSQFDINKSDYLFRTTGSNSSTEFEVDADKVFMLFHQGATIVLNTLHRSWPKLTQACQEIEDILGVSVQTNVYFTPPVSQGFPTHFDTHDVFIAQVHGKKRWQVFESQRLLPRVDERYEEEKDLDKKIVLDVELSAGDTLYLPRGFLHKGVSGFEPSLHLTVGIIAYTFLDFIIDCIDTVSRQDVEFRRSLAPCAVDGQVDISALSKSIESMLDRCSDLSLVSDVWSKRCRTFASNRIPYLKGQLFQIFAAESISLSTELERRPLSVGALNVVNGTVELNFHRKTVSFPMYVNSSLSFILRNDRFRVREIEGDIDDSGKIVLARKLVIEGFLVVSSRTTG